MNKLREKAIRAILGLMIVLAVLPTIVLGAGADDLAEIILSISPDQVVGVPLIGSPQVLLLDSLANPVVGYDLAAMPVTLSVDTGQLSPSILDDPLYLTNGVISLDSLGITYVGPSGLRNVTAANDSVSSSGLLISFNGYDLLAAFDIIGNAVTTVYSGLPTSLNVEVRNGGSRTAIADPYVKAFFTSDVSGSVKRWFTPAANGTVDTIQFLLENTLLVTGEDTLILVLRSEYDIGGTIYATEDTSRIPVTVLDPAIFAIVPGSLAPTAAYAGPGFNLSFEVETVDFIGPIDSTFLTVDLIEYEGGPVVANIFSGSPELTNWSGDILAYDSIPVALDSASGLSAGDYLISMDYRLISGANIFSLSDPTPGTLTVLRPTDLAYRSNTLTPRRVAVENEVQFSFTMEYHFIIDQFSMLELDASTNTFELYGNSFSHQTNLVFENDTLPNNEPSAGPDPFMVSSEKIIIPQAQLGQSLNARASFRYKHLQSGNYLTFEIEFDTEPLEVIEYPLAQLIEVKSIAYNPARVNRSQAFRLEVSVASQSQSDISGLMLKLLSDGDSQFDTILIAPDIVSFDTVTTFFDIIAAVTPGVTETFVVEIDDDSVGVMPPIDANATVSIDSPADISLMWQLSPGASDSLLERNESFSLLVSFVNNGSAEISQVPFTFGTSGVDLGVPDPTEGMLQNDTNLVFLMTAPAFDTAVNLTFDILSTPIDQNSGLPAPLDKQGFVVTLEVASTQAELTVDISLPGEVLLVPGSTVPILDLELTNSGSSIQTDMILNSLLVKFSYPRGDSINARLYLVSGESGFYDDGVRLGRTILGGDRLKFNFEQFILEAKQTRTIQLILKLQDDLPGPFVVELDQAGFDLEFLDDRLAEQPIPVETPLGTPLEFVQEFQSTGSSTEKSFVIETNPFNPKLGPVRFAYILTEPSEVLFRIFTLTGELVHERILRLGEPGTEISLSPHMLSWDGTNDNGQVVLNGIYLAHLSIAATGGEAVIKVAVIK